MGTVPRRRFICWAGTIGLSLLATACQKNLPAISKGFEVGPLEKPSLTRDLPPSFTVQPTIATPLTGEQRIPSDSSTVAPTGVPRPSPTLAPPQSAYLAVVRGEDPALITERAIAALGGMERFCRRGYDVIIKPNICNANRSYEYASTTNPIVVATLVKLCLAAGARRVRVMDNPFAGSAEQAYARSGIAEAVAKAGGEMEVMAPHRFVEVPIPNGRDLKSWVFYKPILDADLVINVPIAKHHSLARLTLGGKNIMGCIENRSAMHRNLGQRIADLVSLVQPQLTVIDAVRILVANGPTGGNLNDVKIANTVIASHDIVAADAYATRLFGVPPENIGYIVAAHEMGLGTMDLTQVKIEEISI